ncbi:DUF2125 domain-containing protein [Sneathiella limimaris]|uniref:DUF2125 domain-containing protein n=1 Tax=Sneathiella limimaris TaxID=1964213 RepID=UPI00146A45CB|nr:DUF2125 domain-containing protein [Sneathiella limimaris]
MRILPIALVVLAALFGAYFYWWNTVADEAVLGFETWKSEQASKGITIKNQPLETGGFPYRVELKTSSITFERTNETLTLSDPWLVIEPWNLKHAVFGLNGDLNLIQNQKKLTLQSEKAVGSLKLNGAWKLKNLAIDLQNSAFSGDLIGAGTADRVQLHFLSDDHDVNLTGTDANAKDLQTQHFLKLALRTDKLVADMLSNAPLGPEMEKLHIVAETDAEMSSFSNPTEIQAWRDKGGALEINDFDIIWGQTRATGNGTVTLDDENYPLGAFTSKIEGYNTLLDIIAKQQKLDKKSAQTARFALDMLAKTSDNGTQYLELPISLQERSAYLGPIRLFDLKPVF